MIEFLSSSYNLPFSVALMVMVLIACVESAAFLCGASLSDLVESSFLDTSFHPVQSHLEAATLLGKLFSWFKVGQVPVLVLLIMFLAIFGASGLMLQTIFLTVWKHLLPAFLVSILALCITFPILRVTGTLLNRIIPKDETSAVSLDTFIGRITTITLGTAKSGYAAQAKVKDSFGKHHYIMIEPDTIGEEFKQGESVLIVRREHNLFYVIENTNHLIKN